MNNNMLVRCLAGVVGFAGVVAAVQIGLAAPASAAAQTVVSGSSTTNSVNKSATASCPTGMRVFGGGGDIVGGGHEVALITLKPVSTLVSGQYHDSFVAAAEEDDSGYAANWTVYSYAICGYGLPNQTIQSATLTRSPGVDRLDTSVSCPAGTAPLGFGAQITGGQGNVVLNSLLGNYTAGPYGNPSGWSSAQSFVDQSGFSGLWSQTSYAVCASPPPGLTYQFRDSAYDTTDDKSASADCPAGTRAYGVGGYISYLTGQIHFDRMVPHGAAWNGGDVEARTDQDGFANQWWVTAETICAAGA
jgi:hypothetical protein